MKKSSLNWPSWMKSTPNIFLSSTSSSPSLVKSQHKSSTDSGIFDLLSPTKKSSKNSSKLFGKSLHDLCSKSSDNGKLPTPIMNMLRHLYLKGPLTVGIFRRSANARVCREVEASLEKDPLFDLEDVSIIVVGSVFKDFLRRLPNCLLDSRLYEKWLKAVENGNSAEDTLHKIQALLLKLPSENLLMLKYVLCLLWNISTHSDVNKMCSTNLAVCIGPSLLTPPKGYKALSAREEVSNSIPKLITFMIDHFLDLFVDDVVDGPVHGVVSSSSNTTSSSPSESPSSPASSSSSSPINSDNSSPPPQDYRIEDIKVPQTVQQQQPQEQSRQPLKSITTNQTPQSNQNGGGSTTIFATAINHPISSPPRDIVRLQQLHQQMVNSRYGPVQRIRIEGGNGIVTNGVHQQFSSTPAHHQQRQTASSSLVNKPWAAILNNQALSPQLRAFLRRVSDSDMVSYTAMPAVVYPHSTYGQHINNNNHFSTPQHTRISALPTRQCPHSANFVYERRNPLPEFKGISPWPGHHNLGGHQTYLNGPLKCRPAHYASQASLVKIAQQPQHFTSQISLHPQPSKPSCNIEVEITTL